MRRHSAVGAALVVLSTLALPARAGFIELLSGGGLVQVTRTSHGVAHVESTDDEGLAFGLGYAHAQDNVCATADALVTVRGERSRWFGSDTSGLLGERTLPNRVIDLYVRSQLDDARLGQAWQQASPQARALVRGVVAGYDRYLEDAHGRLPRACAGKPWVQPMTVGEFRRLVEIMMTEDGAVAWADAVVAAQPPADNGAPVRPAWLPQPPVDGVTPAGTPQRPVGSIAFAFGRDSSLSGQGLLLANPHMPWNGPNRLWQVHLTVPGQFDAMGVTLGVLPVVAIGFNHSLAWSLTASAAHHFTLHELHLAPGNPRAYVVDGQVEPMASRTVRVFERNGDGSQAGREQTFWSTRYGPIVVAPTLGLEWTPQTAYALQDAERQDARFLDTALAMGSSTDIASLRAALALQGLPWMSAVAADRLGRVLFADASSVPDVDAGRLLACGPARETHRLGARLGLVILDGSRAACDWGHDPASHVPGLTPFARGPLLERNDWVQSTGDGAWLANPAAPLRGYSPLYGPWGTPRSLAERTALREIARRLEGRDDLALHQRMGPDQLAALIAGQVNLAASVVLEDLLAICPEAPTEAARTGCAALALWDRTDNVGARGAHVFREFWRRARALPGLWRVPFDVADPVYTPFGLAVSGPNATPGLAEALFVALGQAVRAVRDVGFVLDAPLGLLQTHASPAGPVPLAGGEAFEGVLGALSSTDVVPLKRTGYDLDFGTSYLQIVAFEAGRVDARAVLLHGQSSQPDAAHAFDQLPAFGAQRWYGLPYTPEEIAADRVGGPLVLRFPYTQPD